MSATSSQRRFDTLDSYQSMQAFGEVFIEAMPRHLGTLKIPGRALFEGHRRAPVFANVLQTADIQEAMREVLCHPITQKAQSYAESTFNVFLEKDHADSRVLRFFNGWNETDVAKHKSAMNSVKYKTH